jgi:pyruvate ferredoxin oxidoreductase beta subunit
MESFQDVAKELTVGGMKGPGICRGCGPQLGIKLALQTLGNVILINGEGCISRLVKYPNTIFTVPFLNLGPDAASAAAGVWNSVKTEEKNRPLVLAYAGDTATSMNLANIISAAERNDNILYICYNNRKALDANNRIERGLATTLATKSKYSATASIAYPDDFVKKLKKAAAIDGFKYIELLAPCPKKWVFDPSNTVELARLAVETGAWPVYEIENRKLTLTKIPLRLEPIERYLDLQEIKYKKEDLPKIQEFINKSWKASNEGKII